FTSSSQRVGFQPLHRLAELRPRPEQLERLRQSVRCKALLFDESLSPLLVPASSATKSGVFSPLLIPWPELRPELGPDDCPIVFLGGESDVDYANGDSYFAVAASDRLLAWARSAAFGVVQSPTRVQLMTSTRMIHLWGPARSLLAWHRYNRYCSACGGLTEIADAGHRLLCRNADCIVNGKQSKPGATAAWSDHPISHPRLDPSAIVLVTRGGRGSDQPSCLLARKPAFPSGMLSCLAGFAEAGESLEDCVRREVAEEVGLAVGEVTYRGSQAWPFPSQLMIGFEAATAEGDDINKIRLDTEELEFADWFTAAQVSDMLKRNSRWFVPPKAALAHQLIVEWLNSCC
ncbi:hypothetical protein BOX15_Mlig010521g1, partial [Macrostomum lignano]